MSWKNFSYSKKGLIFGVLISILIILSAGWQSSFRHLGGLKDEYKTTIQFCGNKVSEDCFREMQVFHIKNECSWLEKTETDINKCVENRLLVFPRVKFNNEVNYCNFADHRCNSEGQLQEPNLLMDVILKPNIKDGLEGIFMGGFLGLWIFTPLIIGYFFGFIYGKMKSKKISQ